MTFIYDIYIYILSALSDSLSELPVLEEEFEEAVSETLHDISEVVFFLLGALTVVELMDAHRGFDIITASIKATKKKELVVIIGVLTFLRLRRRPKRREREERDLKET